MRKRHDRQSGMTVTELLVVTALIGFILVVTLSISGKSSSRTQLRSLGRELTTTFYEIKQRAARESVPYRMRVEEDRLDTFYFDPEQAEKWVLLRESKFAGDLKAGQLADFAINSSGFLIDPYSFHMIPSQFVSLTGPGNQGQDVIDFTFYSYGGLLVACAFK